MTSSSVDPVVGLTAVSESPLLVIRSAAVDHNIAEMNRFCADRGVVLAPHAKTTLCPEIVTRQLHSGVWGISVATPAQARAVRALGARRIVLANPVVSARFLRWVDEELVADADFEFLCWIDSHAGVRLLADTLGRSVSTAGRWAALVEVGLPGGRTGARTVAAALDVATKANQAGVPVAGVSGYEGIAPAVVGDSAAASAVIAFLATLDEVRRVLLGAGLIQPHRGGVLVSAGGSAYFDLVVDQFVGTGVVVVLRPGCYVAHDHGLYEQLSPFSRSGSPYSLQPVAEVWGRVLSAPEVGLVVVDVGRRDVSHDHGDPIPLGYVSAGRWRSARSAQTIRLSDQHAVVQINAELEPGDWIGFGVSHPCTTFDKWTSGVLVDDGGAPPRSVPIGLG